MDKPSFQRAIPQRRYQVGEYTATVLGEIESDDQRDYYYVLAMVKDGTREPALYVMLDRPLVPQGPKSEYQLRVFGRGLDEPLGQADKWFDLQHFSASALSVAMGVLSLSDETPALLQ